MKQNDDVYEVVKTDARFSILTRILERTGVGEAMSKEREMFTFFAPTDAAFAQLPQHEREALLGPNGGKFIAAILGQHIVPNAYFYTDDLRREKSVINLNGSELKLGEKKNMLRLEDAPVITPGIPAKNGVVFAINEVIPSS